MLPLVCTVCKISDQNIFQQYFRRPKIFIELIAKDFYISMISSCKHGKYQVGVCKITKNIIEVGNHGNMRKYQSTDRKCFNFFDANDIVVNMSDELNRNELCNNNHQINHKLLKVAAY